MSKTELSPPKIQSKRYISKVKSNDFKIVKIKTENNIWGSFKKASVALILLIQLTLIIWLYFLLASAFYGYLLASLILSFFFCIYVLSSNRNSQSKACWIMVIILCFTCGYIFYITSSEKVILRSGKKRYKKIIESTETCIKQQALPEVSEEVKNDCEYFSRAGNFVAYSGTDVQYFSSGSSLFDDILSEMERAEKFIFIEYYIVADGILLNRFLDVLERKVKEGVEVRMIYDDLGSQGVLKNKSKKRIKQMGIKLQPFNQIIPTHRVIPRFSLALNYRDHRKIVNIDGKVAFTGGCNLADEYINEKRMHGYWKDTGIKICGTAVNSVTLFYLRQWEFITKRQQHYTPYLSGEPTENKSVVVPYTDGLEFKHDIGLNAYVNLISGSKERIYIMTPYLVPDEILLAQLKAKAMSGVDVRIILPGIPDKSYVYIMTRNTAERLIDSGVKVYTLNNSFVHSKVMLTENAAIVGSINLDLRSFNQQFESAVYTNDNSVMTDIYNDFEETFLNCTCVDVKTSKYSKLFYRILAAFMRIFAPLM